MGFMDEDDDEEEEDEDEEEDEEEEEDDDTTDTDHGLMDGLKFTVAPQAGRTPLDWADDEMMKLLLATSAEG